MSRVGSSLVGASGVTGSSGGGVAVQSTRDQILQRHSAGANNNGSAATAGGRNKSMEMFETPASPEPVIENAPVTHSRSLLLSGPGVNVRKGLGSSSSTSSSGVEEVDSTTRVKPALAFQQFAGALYTGGGGARSNGAFESGPSALLVAGSKSAAATASSSDAIRLKFESPFVKLQRLQEELKEFDSELRAASAQQPKAAGASADAAQDVWSNLAGNVQQLQNQLDTMLDQPQVKLLLQQHGDAAQAASTASSAVSSSLLPHFDSLFDEYVAELTVNPSFQPFPNANATPAAATTANGAAATPAELAVLPKLDERLNSLEKLLGVSASGAGGAKQPAIPQLSFNSSSAAPSVLPAPDIVSALSSLHAQLLQLNPQRLEFVSRSCKQILIEQESIALSKKDSGDAAATATSAGKSAASAADKKEESDSVAVAAKPYAAQVAHLYALTSRWDSLALTLPALISRLSSLHALHASSATLAQRVGTLERQSSAIDSALAAQKEGVAAVAASVKENIAALHANFKNMDQRIQQLQQKMEQLK